MKKIRRFDSGGYSVTRGGAANVCIGDGLSFIGFPNESSSPTVQIL